MNMAINKDKLIIKGKKIAGMAFKDKKTFELILLRNFEPLQYFKATL